MCVQEQFQRRRPATPSSQISAGMPHPYGNEDIDQLGVCSLRRRTDAPLCEGACKQTTNRGKAEQRSGGQERHNIARARALARDRRQSARGAGWTAEPGPSMQMAAQVARTLMASIHCMEAEGGAQGSTWEQSAANIDLDLAPPEVVKRVRGQRSSPESI